MLQHIATVKCQGSRYDLLDLYELRRGLDGPAVVGEGVAVFDRIQERAGYKAARARLVGPLVSFYEVEMRDSREGSLLTMQVTALRSSADGDAAPDVMHV